MRLGTLAVVGLATLVLASPVGAGPPRNDYLLVLDHRVGPYEYLRSFMKGGPQAYADALDKLGTPTKFRADGNLCHVTWRSAGITVGFASALRPCSSGQLFHSAWYGMSLWGLKWHNRLGLHVGQGLGEVRRIYPNSRFDTNYKSNRLVLLRKRVAEFNFATLEVVANRGGRVTSIEVPAAYIY